MNLDDKKLDEIKQRSALAHKYICELAAGKHRWNMCIPPQPDDSDMALQAPIDDIKFLLEKIKRLEKAVEAQDRCLDAIDDHIRMLQAERIIDMSQMIQLLKILFIGCVEVDVILKGAE